MEHHELIERIERLEKAFQALSEEKSRSDDIKDLFGALAQAQGEIALARATRENLWHKKPYEDLAEVVRVSRPALSKHGLTIFHQVILNTEGQSVLCTILGHKSGQWLASRMRITPVQNDPQSVSSYLSFAKRQTYASLVGVVVDYEDDDAEAFMKEEREAFKKGTALEKQYPSSQKTTFETITKEQHEELQYELEGYKDIAEDILRTWKLSCLADMPKDKYALAARRIREIKRAREG